MVSREGLTDDLNTGWGERIKAGVALALLLQPFVLLVSPGLWPLSLMLAFLALFLNAAFARYLYSNGGLRLALSRGAGEPHGRQRRSRQMKLNALVLGLVALGACSTPAAQESAAPPPEVVALPWTEEFREEALLVAAEVHIVGPPGLRDHLAVGQDTEHHSYTIQTVPEGLLQETLVNEASVGDVPVRCHLDNLTILVERRIVWLERPGPVAVTITAHGDVFWRKAATGEESRSASLTLTGEAPR